MKHTAVLKVARHVHGSAHDDDFANVARDRTVALQGLGEIGQGTERQNLHRFARAAQMLH